MQETIDFLETHFLSEKPLPFGKQKWDAWQKVKAELAQLSHNSGSTKSLCLTCKSSDICDSRSYIQTKILACKRYRAQ